MFLVFVAWAKGCSVVCRKCNGWHHEIICGPPEVGPILGGVRNSSLPPPPQLPSSGNVNASATYSSLTTSVVSVESSTLVSCLHLTRLLHSGLLVSQCMTVRVLLRPRLSLIPVQIAHLSHDHAKPKWVDSEPVAFASFGSGKPSKTDLRHFFSKSAR